MNTETSGPVHEFIAKTKAVENIDPAFLDAPEPNDILAPNLPDSAIEQIEDDDIAAAAK